MSRTTLVRLYKTAPLKVALIFGIGMAGLMPLRAGAENMADALIGAYNTSGVLEQNRALLRVTDESVGVAVSALRPILAWTATARRGFSQTRSGSFVTSGQTSTYGVGLSAQILLYDGGAAALGIQGAKESVLATRQALLGVEQSILFRAVSAYLNVNLQTQNIALRVNNVRVLGEELKAANDRFEVGEVTRTDVALAESKVAQARSELAIARGGLANAQAEYTAAVGHAPGRLAPTPTLPATPASASAAKALAVQNHPDILAAQHQVVVAEITIGQIKRTQRPTVTLGAQIGTTENFGLPDYNRSGSVSLNLKQTIYQGGALTARIRTAIAQRDAARANLLTVQRSVIQNANNAYVRLKVAQASLTATLQRIRSAEVAFRGIREEATLGARTTLDVLTAEQSLLDANTQRISAQAERATATYQLLQVQGLLTAERLGLAVQIYDPTVYYNLVKKAPIQSSKRGHDLDRVLKALHKR